MLLSIHASPCVRSRVRVVRVIAGKGFSTGGSTSSSKPSDGVRKRRADLGKELLGIDSSKSAKQAAAQRNALGPEWFRACSLAEVRESEKKRKPIILQAGASILVLEPVEGQVFVTDVYSTAYKYPLIDGKVELTDSMAVGKKRWTIETPLDGSVYSLETGAVVVWCPKNTPVRALLGGLKTAAIPVPLTIHENQVIGGDVWVRLSVQAAAGSTAEEGKLLSNAEILEGPGSAGTERR